VENFDVGTNLLVIIPEIGLTILAVAILFMDSLLPESRRRSIAYLTFFGMGLIAVFPLMLSPDGETYWGGMIRHDMLSQVFKVIVLLAGSITALVASTTSDLGRKGEFYLIMTVSTLGACLLSSAADIIMIFVALETVSIPLYVLAAFNRQDKRSIESGMKYFLFGSFASAVMLYGFSLLYGFSGQTGLQGIADALRAGAVAEPVSLVIAIVLVFVGFAFKISAVPFHFWTPDVYEGAPTPVTAFISVASKAASFAVLLRFFVAVFPEELSVDGQQMQTFWINLVIAASIVSMTVGNVLALVQTNIKRLLAYSSIAQAGYTLLGVAALQGIASEGVDPAAQGVAAVAYYMLMYTFTNLLAFGVVAIFSDATGSETIADLAGLSRRNRWMALAMTIGLLSLAGIPPAAGFIGKFFLFNAAVSANLEWLAIIGVLNAIVGLYYYLVVIKVIYVDRSADDDKPILLTTPAGVMLGITTIAVIILGVIPQPFFNWALESATSLFS